MKKPRTTITDIARELGISPSTVSRSLNNHPAISDKTRKEVVKLARKKNYQPNLLALHLLQKKTNTIGVIVPEITSYFFSSNNELSKLRIETLIPELVIRGSSR